MPRSFSRARSSSGDRARLSRARLWAEDNGKVLVIADGPQWPPRHDGDRWQWEALSGQARKEWEAIQLRNIEAQTEIKSHGALVGRPPWGLSVNDGDYKNKGLEPNEVGLKYAGAVFTMVAEHQSLADICHYLDSESVITPSGKIGGWSPKSISQIIRSSTYKGRRVQSAPGATPDAPRITYIMKCPALVSPALWQAANDALSTTKSRGPLNIANKTMLSGNIKCGYCGGPMYLANPAWSKVPGLRYRCAGRGGGVRKSKCKNMIPVAEADAIVDAQMSADDADIMHLVPAPVTVHQEELDDVLADLKNLPNLGLPDDKGDAVKSELRATRDELLAKVAAEQTVHAEPVWVSTGQTYSQLWGSLDTAGKSKWLRDAGVQIIGLRADDAKVRVTVERKMAALFWQEGDDGQAEQHTEIPPTVNGNWVFVPPFGTKRKMRRVAPRK